MNTKLLIATLATAFAVQAQADIINITTGATGGNTVNIGTGSEAHTNAGNSGTAIGYNAKSLSGGTAIGEGATVQTVAAGSGTSGEADNAVAVGENATATNRGAMALGGTTKATGFDSSAVGVVSQAHSAQSAAFGAYAHVENNAAASVAAGYNSRVKDGAENAVAVGMRSEVAAANAVALGSRANVAAANSAAIGAGAQVLAGDAVDGQSKFTNTAVAAANGVVSVGAASSERRIINVAGGINDTDAVNVAQLQKVNDDLTTKINNMTNNNSGLASRINGVERNAEDGVALSLATAGLVAPPQGKSGLVVGTGFFRGSNAVAIGYAYTGDSWGVKATGSAAGRGNYGGSLSAGMFW